MTSNISSNPWENHVLFTDYQSVTQICAPLKHIGIDGFFFHRRYQDGSFIDLSTSSTLKWSEIFFENFYHLKYSKQAMQNHLFIEGAHLWTSQLDYLVYEEARQFNYCSGITLTLKEAEHDDIYYFCSTQDPHVMDHYFLNNLDVLKKFCAYFLRAAHLLIKKGAASRMFTPTEYLDSAATPPHCVFDKKSFLELIDPIYHKFSELTPRELECIKLSSLGNSSKEIAKNLQISNRTVEQHLANAKLKLNCENIKELIVLYLKNYEE